MEVKTIEKLLDERKYIDTYKILPEGDTFKDLSTVIIIPNKGTHTEKRALNCVKCGEKNEFETTTIHGLHPIFVEAFKRLVRPMNVPVLDMIVPGREVGEAYCFAIENILNDPNLSKFKYILTIEDDNIIPFIPNSLGPLMMLYEDIGKGFDVAGGLYWTKSSPSMPLLYGDPKADIKDPEGFFKCRYDWKEIPEGPVECNGLGMGFTLFKMELFKDTRIEKPWFKTLSEHSADEGIKQYTQDLYFFQKIRTLGYRVCVDTRVKVGHLDVKSGIIY